MSFKLFGAVVALACASTAWADVCTQGYVRKDGTYVQPHCQANPNETKLDNYSTKGNVNPYTGQKGYVDPYKQSTPSYGYQPVQPAPNPWATPRKSF